MTKKRVMLSFAEDVIRDPVIYNLGQQFNVVTNIRSADVSEDRGWIILELEGTDKDIDDGIAWVTSRGVKVDEVAEI